MYETEVLPSPIRLLIVDDDEEDVFILRRLIMSIEDTEFVVDSVDNFNQACERIYARQHDVYLIDYRLGEKTGLELLKLVEPHKRSEPFIVMSGADDSNLLRGSMRSAAADFIMKSSLNSDMLEKTIIYAIQRKQFERQRVEYLEEVNRSKDEFISIASHQLRTPATGVKQYVGMLREGFVGELSESQQNIVDKAYESNERQLQIVSELLMVAQVDAGKISINKEAVNISQLLHDIIHDLRSIFTSRSQTVELRVPDDEIMIQADANTVRMVCENLLENASKYSEPGKSIIVESHEENDSVVIDVIDHGVGIDEKDRGRLFEKFSRIDNMLSTKVGGTGLGLYWAKKIMDAHDSSLTYHPNPAGGSIFRIKLPKE